MLRKAKKALVEILGGVLSWLAWLMPRRRDLWVFGSWFGAQFSDNSKYLFLYVARERPDLRAVWITRSPRVLAEVRARGLEAHLQWSPRGLWRSMRAGAVVISNGLDDVNKFAVGRARRIQLWHGTPLKKLARDNRFNRVGKRGAMRRLEALHGLVFPLTHNDRQDYVASASPYGQACLATAFGVPLERVAMSGHPRNDAILEAPWAREEPPILADLRRRLSFRRVILYVPTFRDSAARKDLFGAYGFDVAQVDKRLEALDAVLVVKAHALDGAAALQGTEGTRVVVAKEGDVPDVYALLPRVDAMVTDYSSLLFDFLLLDRPLVYAAFDVEEYLSQDREMYLPYEEAVCGPVAKDWPAVLDALEAELAHDRHRARRREANARFNLHHDAESSRRVTEDVLRLLGRG